MALIKTDWVCVLSAGATIDGRNVSEQTIDEMVETYNKDTYSARINIDHNAYGWKLGSVESIKSEVIDGKKKMFAILEPNDYFISLLQSGQKLHTSVEFMTNFAGTGKAYLTGLALTDNPASLGTTELKLSASAPSAEVISSAEVLSISLKPENSILSFFKKEPVKMDKDTLEAMAQMNALMKQTAELLNEVSAKQQANTQAVVQQKAPDEQDQGDKYEAIKAELEQTRQELNDLKTAFENTALNNGKRSEATGLSESEDIGSL
ncbi:MAG: GPO family capsid scaffolding protein [Thiotrichales bacterium]|nr:GPO family capsid scaffolding protein [Thiotrichales bacterium]